jgi:large repetitive protein
MRKLILSVTLLFLVSFLSAAQDKPDLGRAGAYTVLAGVGVENTGATKIDGNLGLAPGTVYTGMAEAEVRGQQDVTNAAAAAGQLDLTLAYQQAAQLASTQNLSGQSLFRRVLTPGVYKFDGPAALTDTLFLDNRGQVGGAFVFQVAGDLTVADQAVVKFVKGATSRTQDVFWQVAGNVSLGVSSRMQGSILAQHNITMGSSARIQGRLLSRAGTISLATNTITIPTDIAVDVTIPQGVKYTVGDLVPFTITARNNGPLGTNVAVTTTISQGLTYVSSTPGSQYDPATGRWLLPAFANGAVETLQVVVRIGNNASSTEFLRSAIDFNGVALVDEVFGNNVKTIDICIAPTVPGTINGPAAACVGSEVTYYISPVSGATGYDWSYPSDWALKPGTNSNTNSITVLVGSLAGEVRVVVKNICTESDPSIKHIATSTTPPPPPGPIKTAPADVNPCLTQGTASYAIDPVATATAYHWTVPGDWRITAGQGTTNITVAIGTAAGEITVAAINGCAPPSNPSVLAVVASANPPSQPETITGDLAPCVGKESVYTVSGSERATAYAWQLPEGWTVVGASDGASITVIAGSTGGEIKVSGLNGCGVSEARALAVAPITNTAPLAIMGPAVNPCVSTEGHVYTVAPVAGASSYFWTVTNGLQVTEGQGTNSIKVNVGANVVSGTISVTALNNCGPSTARTLTITPGVKPLMPQPITGASPRPCVGQTNLVYSTTPVSGATSYVWDLPLGWEALGDRTGPSITVTAGNTAGVIGVRAVNACGPGPARTLAVTPAATVPATALQMSGNANPCAGDRNKPYGVNAISEATVYTWQVPADWEIVSGQGTANILVHVGTARGEVKVTAANNCGDGITAALAVDPSTTPSPAPGPIIYSTAVPCVRQESITYSVAAVSRAQSYKWDITGDWVITGGQGSTAITVTAGTGPATISVKAVNGCGESGSSSLEVRPTSLVPAVPVAITGTTAVCVNQTNLSYSVAAVTAATTYNWSVPAGWQIVAGAGTPTITVQAGTTGGNITVSAGNNCGNSSAQVLAVQTSTTAPAAPGPIAGTGNLCVGQTGLSYSVAAVAGAASYTWSVPTGWTIVSGQGSTSIVVTTGAAAGKIKVKALNGCGESPESELAVAPTNGLPLLPGVIFAGAGTICAEEKNLSYAVAPMTGVSTYNWQVPAGWVITAGQGTPAISVTAGSTAGDISVTAFNNCGASPARVLAVVPGVIPAAPVAISGQPIPCAGSTGNTYTVAAVPGATTYEWKVPEGWSITSGQGTAAIIVDAGSGSGEISVQAGNNCGLGQAALLPVKAATSVPAIPGTISGSSSVCGSNLDLTYTYSVAAETNASNYIWTVPNGWVITSGQGTLNITVRASASAGTISVMSQNGCGLSQVSFLPVSVIDQAPPVPGRITGSTTVCAGTDGVTYSVGSVSGAATYTWAVPEGWTITAGQGTTSIKVKTGATPGEVSVTATNGCGSSAASALAIGLKAIPAQPLAIAGQAHQCAGNTGSIYRIEPVAGALSYTWTVPADWTITAGQGTPAITITAGQASGEVSVTANSDCGSSEGQVLAVTSATTPSPAPGQITPAYQGLICSQQSGLTYSVEPIATATSYAWSVPEGWVITAGQGTTTITVTVGTGTGAISVKALNGCGESDASALPVVPTQTASVSIGAIAGEQEVCSGRTGLVYAVAPVAGATTYTWAVPEGWTITAGQGTHQVTVTAGAGGGAITVTAANTCTTSLPATLDTKVNAMPVAPVEIRDISTPCAGLSYTIRPVGEAQSYTWTLPPGWTITEGAGTATIKVAAPVGSGKGLISVVANSARCSSAPITLEADPARAQGETTIANVFSPNGDRVNDTWEVVNIQNYPDNDVVIINRWGNEVYRSKSYHNQWDGGQLSAGTYFYVLRMKVCDGSYKTYKGYVMIMR